MKKLIILLLCAMVMGGCSAKEQKAVCTIERNGTNQEFTIYAKGDTISATHEVISVDLSEYADNEENLDMAKEAVKAQMNSTFGGKDGVTVSYEEDGTDIKVIVDIDLETATIDTLAELGMMNEGESKAEVLSFDLSVKAVEANGYTCGE